MIFYEEFLITFLRVKRTSHNADQIVVVDYSTEDISGYFRKIFLQCTYV